MSFVVALTVEEVLAALAAGARPIAGGSDLVVAARHGSAPLPSALVAIDRVDSLRTIEHSGDQVRIGATVNHAMLATDPTMVTKYSALADAASMVGSPATRNVGTLGGNVMNASPAMDTGAPLVVLDAQVEFRSVAGDRIIPIGDLWVGPGKTSCRSDELCTAVLLPGRQADSGSAYVRLEYRRAMEIAVVGAAVSVTLGVDGRVTALSVALAAVAPTILSVDGTGSVVGLTVEEAATAVAALASEQARPISDLRAGDRYRRHCVGVMAARALARAAQRAGRPS